MRIKYGRWFCALVPAIALALAALPALAEEKRPSAGKIAVVNGTVITEEDFNRQISGIQKRYSSRGKPLADSQLSDIKKKVLESLINNELLYQESQKKNITIDEAKINEQFERIKKRFSSEEEFKKTLSDMNTSEAVIKSKMKRRMAIQLFIQEQLAKNVTVSDKDTKTYYDSHPDFFKQPEQVKASHILIKVDPKADESVKSEARKKIEEIQKKLQKGEDFATLAKEFSQGPSNVRGGDLGFFGRGQMAKPFEEAAFALKPGEVSDIVETKFGYHLIKAFDKKPETTIAYEQMKNRLAQFMKQEKVKKEIELYLEELKKTAKVEVFLKEESQ